MEFLEILNQVEQRISDIISSKGYEMVNFVVEPSKKGFGDITCNIGFLLAKKLNKKPQEISDIVNIKDSQRWMYSKFLGLTLINAIKTATNSDEIVQDIYLYASSQHSLSGVYYKLT